MDFKSLLDRSLLIEISILDILFQSHLWLTVEEISKQTSYNRKTIIKYIGIIEDYPELDGLLKKRGTGIKLEIDKIDYNKIKSRILKKSVPFIMIDRILKTGSFSMSYISQETFLSESNIYKYMKKLKEILSPYEINLIKIKNQYILSGDEKNIRYYLYLVYWQIYKGVSWPFSNDMRKRIFTDLQLLSQKYHFNLTVPFNNQLSMIIAINYLRFRTKNPLYFDHSTDKLFILNESISAFDFIAEMFKREYHLPVEETHFFFFYLLSRPSFFYFWKNSKKFINSHKDLDTDQYRAAQLIISGLMKRYPTLKIDFSIIEGLYSIHYHSYFFKNFATDVSNYKIDNYLSKNFPELKKELTVLLETVDTSSLNNIFFQKTYLITHYSILVATILSETYFEKKIFVKLDTDFPFYIEQIVKQQLLNHFKSSFNLSFVRGDSNEFDLLLTVPNSESLNTSTNSEKVIFITPDLTEPTLKIILNKLRKLF